MSNKKVEMEGKLISIVRDKGADPVIVKGKKHPKLKFEYLGENVTYIFPGSPSDWRAEKNCEAGLRRILRDIEQRKAAA